MSHETTDDGGFEAAPTVVGQGSNRCNYAQEVAQPQHHQPQPRFRGQPYPELNEPCILFCVNHSWHLIFILNSIFLRRLPFSANLSVKYRLQRTRCTSDSPDSIPSMFFPLRPVQWGKADKHYPEIHPVWQLH